MGVFVAMYILLYSVWGISSKFPLKQRTTMVCVFSFFILWIVQSVRAYTIGVDLSGYIPLFERIAKSGPIIKEGENVGYVYYNYIISLLSTNPSIFLSLVSASLLIPFTIVVKRYSLIPILSFIIFASFVVYFFSFSGLRQSIAIGITTISYIYIENKRPIIFFALILLATSFHSTAIIFLIAYPLCNWIKMSGKTYAVVCIGFLFVLTSLSPIIKYLIPLLLKDSAEHYMQYMDVSAEPAYNLAICVFLYFLSTFLIKNPSETDKNMQKFLFCGFCCQCTGLFSPVAPRIGFYFFIFIGIALANVAKKFSSTIANRQIACLGLALFMTWFFFSRYSSGYLEVVPYKFIWD